MLYQMKARGMDAFLRHDCRLKETNDSENGYHWQVEFIEGFDEFAIREEQSPWRHGATYLDL